MTTLRAGQVWRKRNGMLATIVVFPHNSKMFIDPMTDLVYLDDTHRREWVPKWVFSEEKPDPNDLMELVK